MLLNVSGYHRKKHCSNTDEDAENTTMCQDVDPLRSTIMQPLARLQGQRSIARAAYTRLYNTTERKELEIIKDNMPYSTEVLLGQPSRIIQRFMLF